jgi:hypothetical protein
VPQLGVVSESIRCDGRDRTMAASLQRGTTPFESALPDADGLQDPDHERPTNNRSGERRFPVIAGPKNLGRSGQAHHIDKEDTFGKQNGADKFDPPTLEGHQTKFASTCQACRKKPLGPPPNT